MTELENFSYIFSSWCESDDNSASNVNGATVYTSAVNGSNQNGATGYTRRRGVNSMLRRQAYAQRTQLFEITHKISSLTAMQNIVTQSWVYPVLPIGYDTVGLTHKRIEVRQIYAIQNDTLLNNYVASRHRFQETANQLRGGRFQPITNVKNVLAKKPILTSQVETGGLGDNPCNPRINEVYLFHGTKQENVDGIVKNGFDLQRSGGGLYGKALYFAESAQKSDQYAGT